MNISVVFSSLRYKFFDLGMAIGLLIQSKQIIVNEVQKFAFIGELSLNGELRACTGILPMAIEAKNRGIKNLIVPINNKKEAELVKEINVFSFETLKEVIEFIDGTEQYNMNEYNDNIEEHRESIIYFWDILNYKFTYNLV